jgi:hypothetical protein
MKENVVNGAIMFAQTVHSTLRAAVDIPDHPRSPADDNQKQTDKRRVLRFVLFSQIMFTLGQWTLQNRDVVFGRVSFDSPMEPTGQADQMRFIQVLLGVIEPTPPVAKAACR